MTTNYQDDLGPGEPSTGSAAQDAQDKAREAAGTAAGETRHVAGVAQGEAKKVASEATDQIRGLLDEATQQVAEQTSAQKSRLAGTVRSFGDDLQSMQQQGESSGLAGQVVSQVADRARSLASTLEDREPTDLLEDVRRFARQRPGTFLLGALAAGVVAGRVARGAKGARDGSAGTTSPVVGDQATRSVGRTPGAPVPSRPVTAPIPPTDDHTSPAYLAEGGDAGASYLGTEKPVAPPRAGSDEPFLDGPDGGGVARP